MVPLVVLLGSVGGAAAKKVTKVTSCDARAGKTLLENSAARVYSFHNRDYACARAIGRPSLLFRADHPGEQPIPAHGIELAGHYVVWSETDGMTDAETIVLLDAATRTYRTAGSLAEGQHEYIGDFVVNSRGTVVFTHDYEACVGGAGGGGCIATTKVIANSTQGNSTLANAENSSKDPAPPARVPITSLGLSDGGTVAFWIDNGKYTGASIP